MTTRLLKPVIDHYYPTVQHANGVYLTDSDGKTYFDGCSGAICANLGHGNKRVIEAMAAQAQQITFSYRTQFTNTPVEALAQFLTDRAPAGIDWAFFVNSGSEATEAAMRLALQYWQEQHKPERSIILSRNTSYHGVTLGALSVSGHKARRQHYEARLHQHAVVAPAFCHHCPFGLSPQNCRMECAEDWERAILEFGPQNIAAIIAEPIVGAAGGAITPPTHYFQRVKEICSKYNILIIADEVMTGLGRTGNWFESVIQGMQPDLIVIGKGMSAGYTPMAGVLISSRIVDVLRTGSGSGGFGHTYSGNPLSAAISLAVLQEVEREQLLQASKNRGQQLKEGLLKLQAEFPFISDVRGKGLLLAFEIDCQPASDSPLTTPRSAADLTARAQDHGLLLYPAGIAPFNNAVLVAPPLTSTADEIDALLDLLYLTLDTFRTPTLTP